MSIKFNNTNNTFNKMKAKQESKIVSEKAADKIRKTYSNTLSGAITGIGVGIADGYITNKYRKRTIKKGIDEIKGYSLAEKKEFIKTLNNNGMTVKTYKEKIKKTLERSTGSEILKKSVIYSLILTGIGLFVDLKHKKDANKPKNSD